jgi:DNA polymerase-4
VRENVLARTIVLKLRYDNFETITRQTTLRHSRRDEKEIRARISELLERHWDRQRALRLLGVGAHNLIVHEEARQLEMDV